MRNSNLFIEVVGNGFIAREDDPMKSGTIGRIWVFETPEALSEFILVWGKNSFKAPSAVNLPNNAELHATLNNPVSTKVDK